MGSESATAGARAAVRALLALALLAGCATAPPGPGVLRGPELRFGDERYSAWFADERDGIVYFGLSPFWSALWASGDPRAELAQPGDHVIGRFELARERFLAPLVVRSAAQGARGSVWDVLAHPNGWVYYTTFFEEMGRVRPATGEVEHFPALGRGLNELALGPSGEIYATRYGSGEDDPARKTDGGVVVISESGEKLREASLHARDGAVTAVKSVAVEPVSGRVFVNADVLRDGGGTDFARFVLLPDLTPLHRSVGDPELLFMAFAPGDRSVAVEDAAGRLRLSVGDGEVERAALDLGPRADSDFAQDIHFAPDGTAAIAFWSGRVELVRERQGRLEHASSTLQKPPDCAPPARRSLVYSAFTTTSAVYATLFCGTTILRAPLPTEWRPVAPSR